MESSRTKDGTKEGGSEESGFLFLPECDAVLISSSEETIHESKIQKSTTACNVDKLDIAGKPIHNWTPIEIPHVVDSRKNKNDIGGSSDNYCSFCDLALHERKSNLNRTAEKYFLPQQIPRFDGTMSDIKPNPMKCTCERKRRKRNDGALLFGLALACQDDGHITIKSAKILLHDVSFSSTSSCSVSNKTTICCKRVSLLITFAVHDITQQAPLSSSLKSKRMSRESRLKRRRFMSNSSKPLPSATQLLLSIMRSDFDYLNYILLRPTEFLNSTRSSVGSHTRTIGIFPPKLTLDEVYRRIGAAKNPQLELEEGRDLAMPQLSSKKAQVGIVSLPKDVFQSHIGTFLKAKSLYSLRCTCKYLHRVLQAVIPGLRLSLYSHQINSLSWMRNRETNSITEGDLASVTSTSTVDLHRAASGGATVLLHSNVHSLSALVRISQSTGEEVTIRTDDPLGRRVARGGLLCDDPGLGKTVTVLSLILQTIGLSTEAGIPAARGKDVDTVRDLLDDEQIFAEYWREQSIPQFRSQEMNRLLVKFMRENHDSTIFEPPIIPEKDGVPDYFEVISKPICLHEVKRKVHAFEYDDSFDSFESDVLLCFRNAMQYHPSDSLIHKAALFLEKEFIKEVKRFKLKQLRVAKKSFARAVSKPNSSVAALVEKSNQEKLKKSLTSSSGTLIVVPSVLLEHWQDQIQHHIDMKYCTSKRPIVFEYTGSAENCLRMEEMIRECKVEKTHTPFVFVDKTSTRKLPSPQFLAMFSLVITTTQRFTNEWKNGSFEEELREKESSPYLEQCQLEYDFRSSLAKSEEACPLLKVNWLRMVVDEGHSMGRGKENSAISFASWISAERRWAMTGTPTRQTISQSGLSSILNLMQYLQHGFFSRRLQGESVWKNLIARGWSRGSLASFFRLRALLSLLMVRHTKLDIKELPLPKYQSMILPMSREETKTYNTLVCAVQSNLIITSMKGKTSGLQDSLLHRSQARHARNALRNIRLVCAGGTQVIPTVSQEYWDEFLRDFALCNPDPTKLEKMKTYLLRATTEAVSPCDCCGTLLTTLLVFPCGDLVCTECVDSNTTNCIVCDQKFDVDLFQRLQPGMDYQWLHNIEEEAKTKKKSNTYVGALQASDAPEVLEAGRGVLAPVDDSQPRRRTAKPGDGHKCVYDPKRGNGQCELCWKEHDYCNFLNPRCQCAICYRTGEPCPDFESKPFYVVKKLERLHEKQEEQKKSSISTTNFSKKKFTASQRHLKVIVFSQFRKVLNTTGDRLIRRFGTACIAEYWGQYRRQELHKFIYDKQCFCMLLGKDGSEGLDLSFVTNIIFLEQVWDKSLEQQAVARAWRMGATGSVEVETLIAESSVEETMAHLESNILENGNELATAMSKMNPMEESGKGSEYQRAKLQFLLKGLKLTTNSTTNPLVRSSSARKRATDFARIYVNPSQQPKRRRVKFEI